MIYESHSPQNQTGETNRRKIWGSSFTFGDENPNKKNDNKSIAYFRESKKRIKIEHHNFMNARCPFWSKTFASISCKQWLEKSMGQTCKPAFRMLG